jgi:hypothetical protein
MSEQPTSPAVPDWDDDGIPEDDQAETDDAGDAEHDVSDS